MSARHWSISSAAKPDPPPLIGEPAALAGAAPAATDPTIMSNATNATARACPVRRGMITRSDR